MEYAEPNYIARANAAPNDAKYSQQWAHQNTKAESGWDITTGSSDVIIAIIDTGVDYDHEDLKDNIWEDADGNPGKDFVDISTSDYTDDGFVLLSSRRLYWSRQRSFRLSWTWNPCGRDSRG